MSSRQAAAIPRLVLGCVLFCLSGCGPPAETERSPSVDLLTPLAELHAETAEIDVGTEAARPHLVEGFSWDSVTKDTATEDTATGDDVTYAWSDGPRSRVELWLGEARDLEIELHGWPFAIPEAADPAPQTVTARIDRADGSRVGGPAELGTIEMTPGPGVYSLPLPAHEVEPGPMVLTLEYGRHVSPRQVDLGDDDRELAAAWSRIRIVGASERRPRLGDDGLFLPRATAAQRHLEVPPGAVLQLEGLVIEHDANLQVGWRAAHTRNDAPGDLELERNLAELDARDAMARLELPERPFGLATIELRATGGDVHVGSAALWTPVETGQETPIETEVPTPAGSTAPSADETPPHVVLVVVDTLRRDVLGAYGEIESESVSPAFDRLAERSHLFEGAQAQSSWTRPSVASVLTGLGPLRHGVVGLESVLGDAPATLAEELAAAGYSTAGHVTNVNLVAERGFARGFDVYRYEPLDADAMGGIFEELLDVATAEGPGFVYLHLMEPHAPYEPRPDLRRRHAAGVGAEIGTVEHIRDLGHHRVPRTPEVVRDLRRLYDGEVAWFDELLARVVDELDARGLAGDTVLAVVSDHGDAFGEHGVFGHGWDLHAEVIDVPLLLHLPGQEEGRRIEAPVSHVDLLPTLLELAGEEPPPDVEGRTLLPLLGDEPPPDEEGPLGRAVLVHQTYDGRDAVAVVTHRWKLILPLSPAYGHHPLLFDRHADPGETHDLARRRPVIAGYLEEIARRRLLQAPQSRETKPLDEETRRELEALGYVGG